MQVGDIVTLTVKNPLWGNRSAYASHMAEFQTYTGTVVPNPSWVGADQLCLSTGTVQFPFRVLDRDRIVGLSEAREKPESKVFTIEGAKGKTYLVTLERGLWGCNCTGFGFRRACSHVVSAKSLILQGKKNLEKSEEKCCFNSKSAVQSKSKVKRGDRRPILTMEKSGMAKVTKTQITIRVMTENKDKPMSEVVKLIAKENSVSEAVAKGAYRWCVKHGKAPGTVEAAKTVRATKTKKVPAEKMLSELGLKKSKFTGKVKAEVTKSAEEIAKIKRDNLARMRQVSAKLAAIRGQEEDTLPAYEEKDPFSAPASLTMDEVRALV